MTDKIKPDYYKTKDGDLLDTLYKEKGIEYIRNVCDFNMRKYALRSDKKNGQEDLDKAEQFKRRLIEFEKLEREIKISQVQQALELLKRI